MDGNVTSPHLVPENSHHEAPVHEAQEDAALRHNDRPRDRALKGRVAPGSGIGATIR